jgi:hypothetical protein
MKKTGIVSSRRAAGLGGPPRSFQRKTTIYCVGAGQKGGFATCCARPPRSAGRRSGCEAPESALGVDDLAGDGRGIW